MIALKLDPKCPIHRAVVEGEVFDAEGNLIVRKP
jgi:hypothetical protein